jgi:hypothetical protein
VRIARGRIGDDTVGVPAVLREVLVTLDGEHEDLLSRRTYVELRLRSCILLQVNFGSISNL